mmetsp:Transcript_127486/g.284379  ORF Transcript_127486/g.284379 Transcript_127486/m.284379 type:complete len:89 (-) Transcript_127486:248-514(-)
MFSADLDEVFAYTTPKSIVVKDRRLGMFLCFLQGCAVSYVVFSLFLYNCEHLDEEEVFGEAQLSLHPPFSGDCDPLSLGCAPEFKPLQ